MDKLNELKALADLAQQLEDNGHFVEANTVHNKFIKIAQAKRTYTVKGINEGDSELLIDIANKTGVSVYELEAYNKGIGAVVPKGKVINLGPAPKKQAPGTYAVSQGENLSIIARNHGISLQALLKINPGIDPSKKLYQGQQINIPKK